MDKSIEKIMEILPRKVSDFFNGNTGKNITEIRIRKGFEIKVSVDGVYHTLKETIIDEKEINKIFYSLCNNTVSAFEEQLSHGFITLEGGHRVGVTGKFIKDENNYLLTDVYSMNIRISHFCKLEIEKNILDFKKGLLIAGKPHSGKTTYIKNICYCLQDKNIAVCDERNELYSRQINCDYIINMPKHIAVQQAVRTLNPEYIVCDEIGNNDEIIPITNGVISGVKFICSVHRSSIQELYQKSDISYLLSASVFDRIVLLDSYKNNFYIKEILDV